MPDRASAKDINELSLRLRRQEFKQNILQAARYAEQLEKIEKSDGETEQKYLNMASLVEGLKIIFETVNSSDFKKEFAQSVNIVKAALDSHLQVMEHYRAQIDQKTKS